MKTKNKITTNKEKSNRVTAVEINVVIVIIVFTAGFLGVLSGSLSFMDALREVFQKMIGCLQHKADHILEIVVIIILVSIKGIAKRFDD